MFGNKDIAELTASDGIEFAVRAEKECLEYWETVTESRQQLGLKIKEFPGANSFNACLNAISAVLNKAVEKELVPAKRKHNMSRIEIDTPKRFGLTKVQVEELLESALTDGKDSKLDH
jgi:hypothetical protein